MNWIPLLLYAAALAAYTLHFARREPTVGRAATTLLVGGALAHTFVVGMQTMEVAHVPVTSASSAVSTFVLLLVLAYLFTEMTTEERALGAFILPLVVVLQSIPALYPMAEERAEILRGPLFGIHVSSLLCAYASFALACVIGILYVLQFKELKAKHFGFLYARLPALDVLDTMNQRAITVGWICLTIGLVAGFIWAGQVQGSDPRLQAMSIQDPKIFVALICWVVYSFEMFAARRIGWGGRRAAYLSAVGFAIVLLNFLPISYFLSNSHNF
ncbi:MAG: inner membrane protein YpjD [Vicinamibacterales bacterium]